MAKNIVICCDGTGNEFGGDCNSNVVKLYTTLIIDGSQVGYYYPGVGTMASPTAQNWVEKQWSQIKGLAFGAGLLSNVGGAYRYLMDVYADGDHVYLFGFSRGSYTARALAGVLHMYGLLSPGNDGRGAVIGSELIGQEFSRPEYFHSRPSAAGAGYDGTSSGGTNLGPNNPRLKNGAADFAGIRQLAEEYRKRNGLAPDAAIPIDAVTRSASGLDPDISPDNAALQVSRVARARGLSEETVRRLVAEHTKGPQLGFLGNARVPVLELNLALDQLARR